MSQKSSIQYLNWSGTLILKWNRNDFPHIAKALQLKLCTQNLTGIKTYYLRCTKPCPCKILIYQNGRIMLFNATTYSNLQQILAQQIFCVLMQKIPHVQISAAQQLTITTCTAKINFSFSVDIGQIQQQLKNQYGIQSKGNYAFLPFQLHKVQKIIVQVSKKYCKITKAQAIQDIYLFSKYLEYLLARFKQDQTPKVIENIEHEWMQMKKNLKKINKKYKQSNNKHQIINTIQNQFQEQQFFELI